MEELRNSGIILCQEISEEISYIDVRSNLEDHRISHSSRIVQLNEGYYPQTFRVIIFSDGANLEYFSIEIFKILNYEPIDEYAFDEITWTFSIVDVNGIGKFFQSFSKENFVDSPYKINIPNFIKSIVVLEQAEELLPGDELTLRCEVFSMSFPGKYLITSDTSLARYIRFYEKYEPSLRTDTPAVIMVLQSEERLIRDICNFLINLKDLKNNKIELKSVDLLKQELLKRNKSDELLRAYLAFDPLFQTYRRLERKVMECVNLKEVVEPECLIPWQQLKEKLFQNLHMLTMIPTMVDELHNFVRKLNREKYDEEMQEINQLDKNNDFYDLLLNYLYTTRADNFLKFFIQVVECELENDMEYMEDCSENNGEEQTLIVKTKDHIIFTLPFRRDGEALGSKLISASTFFRDMLECTKNDIAEPVTLRECSQVFLQVLRFLQGEQILTKPIKILYDTYEAADKYLMGEMLQHCADLMKPLLSKENFEEVQFIARVHRDKYLKDIVDAFKDQNIRDETGNLESEKDRIDYILGHLFSPELEYFDFYK
ncbi:hypothetical protein AVEN_251833-1 [Araneus ventricosus]|uniref:BTB domain-containing protein n=1 Tax=Araneus ventricosus TaxID=182803 RepID=A0A4Y2FVC0_ARAVE|nr:hypothetical protein AVEN_251833-1 [Araneus ventricosus]